MPAQLIRKHIQLGECQIAYWQSPELSTTPILFLHGWGISAEPYHEVLHELAASCAVIAPDLPSFAGSHYAHRLKTYEEYAAWILTFLRALEIPAVHLIGHSLGGGIAIALSALHPSRVASVTLVDSTGSPIVSLPEILLRRSMEMTLQLHPPKFYLQLVEIPRVFAWNCLFNFQNVVQALWISTQVDIRHYLPRIISPCLLIWSEKDFTTALSVAHEMVETIPNAKLVTVPEGFHEWAVLYPEKFAMIALNFIQQQKTYRAVEVSLS